MKTFNLLIVVCFYLLFSCEGVLLEEDVSDKQVILIAPSNNLELENKSSYNFDWEDLGVETDYQIQIARPNFENPQEIVLDSVVSNHRINLVVPEGSYEWRVRAKNNSFNSAYASPFSFRIKGDTGQGGDTTNEIVALFAPSNNAELEQRTDYNFSWNELSIATGYQIQIVTPNFDNPLQVIVDDDTLTETNVDVELDAGTYQWRVRGRNNTSIFEYSTPFNVVIRDNE